MSTIKVNITINKETAEVAMHALNKCTTVGANFEMEIKGKTSSGGEAIVTIRVR